MNTHEPCLEPAGALKNLRCDPVRHNWYTAVEKLMKGGVFIDHVIQDSVLVFSLNIDVNTNS